MSNATKRLLLIEDDPIMGESLVQRFELEEFDVHWCRQLSQAKSVDIASFHSVISDVRLGDGIATTWFLELPAELRQLPWYFLTGYGGVDEALSTVRAGAREYLTKPFDIEKLVALVATATSAAPSTQADLVLGVSSAMRQNEILLRRVSSKNVTVLLTGESGVGKEVAARLVHEESHRSATGELIAVNCAAIPETMMEAEFFGYEKGAFSGAVRQHRGFLERADGGTLLLDEVGDLPLQMQAKLLRALQEKCFFRLGSERITHSDFRLISATNSDLFKAMKNGTFREDLYYRLAVIQVTLPPLRERPEDIRWLAEMMLKELVEQQETPIAVSDAFMHSLLLKPWRGNARELRSFLEESVILSEAGILDASHALPSEHSESSEGSEFMVLKKKVEQAEREHISLALTQANGNVGQSAQLLGISRKTLWEKMKRLKLGSVKA